ncbi:Enoyl reductase LovC [Colletotrichum tanaceti]|uniref:Enoyl reductase LovC n=1 Tax=Colletotrichum tanaceti TaxID=1306861 RepID=A0A4U6X8H6_9PEZI|nr:Enoyl reductase LovC [Colletotrichum tanaceti]
MNICYDAMGAAAGRYVALDSFPVASHSRRAVRPSWVFAMTAFGCAVDWVAPYKCRPSPADRLFAESWMRRAADLVRDGHVRPLRFRVVGDSLGDVSKGLEELRRGAVSGEKLVCIVDRSIS